MTASLTETLTDVARLADLDSRDTPGLDGDKDTAEVAMPLLGKELADLQERLWAEGVSGGHRSVLLVLQGMDTSGKGGIIRSVAAMVDPQGLNITSFKRPTPEELAHDFLWRVRRALPSAGSIGVFDRSHYEDVLIGRVRELATPEEIERRYDAINAFEQEYVDGGGTLVKCLLHIDADDQRERLQARLEDPAKHWKFTTGDLDERAMWQEYQQAYDQVLQRCSTPVAPWAVVPSGRKWYRNWAVAQLLLEALQGLDLQWPQADFDVEAAKARLAAE